MREVSGAGNDLLLDLGSRYLDVFPRIHWVLSICALFCIHVTL